jgi:hypothetical protein
MSLSVVDRALLLIHGSSTGHRDFTVAPWHVFTWFLGCWALFLFSCFGGHSLSAPPPLLTVLLMLGCPQALSLFFIYVLFLADFFQSYSFKYHLCETSFQCRIPIPSLSPKLHTHISNCLLTISPLNTWQAPHIQQVAPQFLMSLKALPHLSSWQFYPFICLDEIPWAHSHASDLSGNLVDSTFKSNILNATIFHCLHHSHLAPATTISYLDCWNDT